MLINFRKFACQVSVSYITLSLAACGSGEPSQGDMLEAVKASSFAHEYAVGMLRDNGLTRYSSQAEADQAIDRVVSGTVVEKTACAEARGAPGYVCDFRFGLRKPDGQMQYRPMSGGRFFKSGASWSIANP